MRDPVNEPLGQAPEARPRRTAQIVVAVGLVALAIGAIALLRTVDWRNRGEPYAVARIEPSPGPSAAPAASAPAKADPAQAAANADQVEAESGVKVVRSGGGGAGGSMIIDVPQALSLRLAPAPDRRLTEKSRFGLLPRIGADGARPADVYARPVFASAKLQARRAARGAAGRRPRPQPRQHRRRDRAAAGGRVARLRALRRRPRGRSGGGARSRPRNPAAVADGAVHLPCRQSRPAHAADQRFRRRQPRTRCAGRWGGSSATPGSSIIWAASSPPTRAR